MLITLGENENSMQDVYRFKFSSVDTNNSIDETHEDLNIGCITVQFYGVLPGFDKNSSNVFLFFLFLINK